MTKKEALQILIDDATKMGTIGNSLICITASDIKSNIRCNDFTLNLDWIQDLFEVAEDGDLQLYQGHSLKEVKFKKGALCF